MPAPAALANPPAPTQTVPLPNRTQHARVHAFLAGTDSRQLASVLEAAEHAAAAGSSERAAIRYWRHLYADLTEPSPPARDGLVDELRLLASLPMAERRVFLLRVWEGLDHAELAAVTGESEAVVRRRLAGAVRALRHGLGQEDEEAHWALRCRQRLQALADDLERRQQIPTFRPRPPPPRRLAALGWSVLVLILIALGLARWWFERSPVAPAPTPLPAASPLAVDAPLSALLSAATEDHAVISDYVDLALLERLDFLLWLHAQEGDDDAG